MTSLLPCPFCGGGATRHDIEAREDVDNAGASYIECDGCGACTQLHFDRKENLLDSWNRRHKTTHQEPVAWNCIYPTHGHITLKRSEAEQAARDGAEVRSMVYAEVSE
jgi:Lar family restriction alleviation protein